MNTGVILQLCFNETLNIKNKKKNNYEMLYHCDIKNEQEDSNSGKTKRSDIIKVVTVTTTM